MAFEDIILGQIYQISLLVKGLGIFAIGWIIYASVLFFLERKKMNKMNELGEQIKKLSKKIDNLSGKNKR